MLEKSADCYPASVPGLYSLTPDGFYNRMALGFDLNVRR
jgi:hypothetical protein